MTPLVIAGLLHDCGYPECADMEDLKRHPGISAAIAEPYPDGIDFDKQMSEMRTTSTARI